MMTRKELAQALYQSVGQALLGPSDARATFDDNDNIEDLWHDLHRLRSIPEAKDVVEESHLRFLARCRLTKLGPFQICGFIGAGKCGAVYRAVNLETKQRCAIKILLFPRNEEEQARFVQEGNLLTELDHPGIVRGLLPTQTIRYVPVQWYAMELVEQAQTLDKFSVGAPLASVLETMAQVCEALAFAHGRSVYHRDLHPQNIMVLPGGRAKILDFGVAKWQADGFTFRPIGSLLTAAPEQLWDARSADGSADVLAVGCMLYYIVTGKWPFLSQSFGELMVCIQKGSYDGLVDDAIGLSPLIREALIVKKEARPTAESIASQLRAISSNITSVAVEQPGT